MSKTISKVIVLLFIAAIQLFSQKTAVIIGHECVNLEQIPDYWLEKSKADLFIGYGHTSHGSQITSGMSAINAYFNDGKYAWSYSGANNSLHLFEGTSYDDGYLALDCGYSGWDDKTRRYLDDRPDCNVIMWSWCGQVNDVDLETHYLQRMAKLEKDYPNVRFVYMTGHLEGDGPNGSLFKANQKIRDFCIQNNKILFDFADIEKYSPDCDINYKEFFADDGCNYNKPGGGSGNWAYEWLAANPDHLLAKISQKCSDCAHSVSLNCVKKGVAAWHLWARIAGWDGIASSIKEDTSIEVNKTAYCHPNPTDGLTDLHFKSEDKGRIRAMFFDSNGNNLLSVEQEKRSDEIVIPVNFSYFATGAYYFRIELDGKLKANGNLRVVR